VGGSLTIERNPRGGTSVIFNAPKQVNTGTCPFHAAKK